MQTWYYPKTIRNITLAFTDLFNDLIVKRLDDVGLVSKTIEVPIKFGPVNKYQQIQMERESGTGYYIKLPGLAVTLDGVNYASDRAMGVNEERFFHDVDMGLDNLTEFYKDVNPTPYDFSYSLHVLTESMDDFSQILENILPYFNPSLHLRVKEFSFLNVERDLQVTQTGISTEFLDPQSEGEKRYVNGSIQFTVKGYMYRPVTTAKVIKEIHSKYFISDSTAFVSEAKTIINDVVLFADEFTTIPSGSQVKTTSGDMIYNTTEDVTVQSMGGGVSDVTFYPKTDPSAGGVNFFLHVYFEQFGYTTLVGETTETVRDNTYDYFTSLSAFDISVEKVGVDRLRFHSDTISFNYGNSFWDIEEVGSSVTVIAEDFGPDVVLVGELDTIVTPISGWNSVNNPIAGITGNLETLGTDTLVSTYSTSGFIDTSAAESVPTSAYDVSGVDGDTIYLKQGIDYPT